MMTSTKMAEYFRELNRQLSLTESEEAQAISEAAALLTKTIAGDGLIHVFGSGHGQIFAMEMFYRSGGLVPVNPLLMPHLSITPVAKLSTVFERMEGFSKAYLELENVSPQDALIVVSVSGRNGSVVDMAIAAKERGMPVVAITSKSYCDSLPSRHSSGKYLKDFADITIDLKCHHGDACLAIEGVEQKFSATSSVLGIAILQAMTAQIVENLVKAGHRPPIWTSANTENGDRLNASYFQEYKNRISSL